MGFIRVRARRTCVAVAAAVAALTIPAAASAAPFDPTGVIKPLRGSHLNLNANQSNNWFGYNQGSIEQNGKFFNSISANWTVPTATQHTRGEPESSSDWIGIGGGCIDAGCNITDASGLIQTGTEQDVDATGAASYSAWWELVPAPSTTINNMTVRPGDRMYAKVAEVVSSSNLWTITLQDVTRHESFTQTVPYPSSHATAEWIEDGGSGGSKSDTLRVTTVSPCSSAVAAIMRSALSLPSTALRAPQRRAVRAARRGR